MKQATKLELEAVQMSLNMPDNTVVLAACVKGQRTFSVMQRDEIKNLPGFARELIGNYEDLGDEHK